MSRRDGLIEDLEAEARALPARLVIAILLLELFLLGCGVLARWVAF
jgi:hypothetical protein